MSQPSKPAFLDFKILYLCTQSSGTGHCWKFCWARRCYRSFTDSYFEKHWLCLCPSWQFSRIQSCTVAQINVTVVDAHFSLKAILLRLSDVFEPTKCTPGFVEPSLDVLLGTVVCTDHTPKISEVFNMFQRFSINADWPWCIRVHTHNFGFLFANDQSRFLGIYMEIVCFLLKMSRCWRKDGNIISKVKVLKVREDSPLYSMRAQRSCLTHHPVDSNEEENRRKYTTLAHSWFYWKCFCNGVSKDDTTFKVVIEHLDKVDNLGW